MMLTKKLWMGIGILIVLSPLGLIVPDYFKTGSAWGEWGADELRALAGYLPQGFEKLSDLWTAPLPDYSLKGWELKGWAHASGAYLFSAALGVIITCLIVWILGKVLARKDD